MVYAIISNSKLKILYSYVILCNNSNELNKCKVSRIESGLEKEIKLAILKEAAILEQNERVKNPDFKFLERD